MQSSVLFIHLAAVFNSRGYKKYINFSLSGFKIGGIKMSNDYKVNRYIAYNTPSGDFILQNQQGITKIINPQMVNFLIDIEKKGIRTLNKSDMDLFFDQAEGAINFLLKYGIIERSLYLNFGLDTINFASNHKEVGELTDYILKEGLVNYSYYNSVEEAFTESINEESKKTLWVYFLNPYSKSEAKRIRDNYIDKKNTYLLISYIHNGHFYIDSLYSSEYMTPCHLCQINTLESEIRSSTGEEMNYQKLVDMLFQEDENFSLNYPLTKIQIINIASHLGRRIIENSGSDRNHKVKYSHFGEGFSMNLNDFKWHSDTTIHWELCDCYE